MVHFFSDKCHTEAKRFDIKVDVYACNVEIDAITSLHKTNSIKLPGTLVDSIRVPHTKTLAVVYSLVYFGKTSVYLNLLN